MIDHDDADDFILFSLLSNGWFAVLCLIVAVFIFFAANDNEKECKLKSCPAGMQIRLANNTCECFTEATP